MTDTACTFKKERCFYYVIVIDSQSIIKFYAKINYCYADLKKN